MTNKTNYKFLLFMSAVLLFTLVATTGCTSTSNDEINKEEFRCAMKSSVDYSCSYSVYANKCKCVRK